VQPDTLYAGLAWTIAKSSDMGRSWQEVPLADDPEAHGVSSISISAAAPERVYAGICFYSGRKGYVLASSDGGLSYRMVLQESAPVSCVLAHPSRPEVVYAGTGSFFEPVIPGTVYKSTDYGATWSALALSGSVVNSLAVSAGDPNLIYAACGAYDGSAAGIFLSPDGGATWRPSDRGLPIAATGASPSAAVTRIALDPHNANVLAASLFEHGVYISLDAGDYWFAISPVDYHIYTVSLRPANHQKARAATAQAFGRSPSVIAGTSHGAYQYATAGSGLLTGTVSSDADEPIDNAAITASCGGHCLSSSGYYLLMLPAGSHTLTASAPGYATSMHTGLLIQSGQTATCDIKLRHQAGTCIIERLLHGSPHASGLARLRHFRDRVLRTCFWGEGLIRLYYAISAKLCSLYG